MFIAAISMAKTVYVSSKTGSDGNSGLEKTKSVRTLSHAMSLIEAGDTLEMEAGSIFNESLYFPRNGTAWKPIIIEGNGSVICGLRDIPSDAWQDMGEGLFFQPSKVKTGALAPYLVDANGKSLPQNRNLKTMKPGESFWNSNGIYLRCTPNESPANMKLRGTTLVSGVTMEDTSYVTVRNLTAEYFANDGFNMHGYCHGLVFEQITARHNGDDGFSMHEDVGAVVRGGHFHHNNYGIQDINGSRSLFQGLLVEDNRIIGVHFNGGFRSLEDSVVRNNASGEIVIQNNSAKNIGYVNSNPLATGLVFIKNTVVLGGKVAIQVKGPSKAVISNSAILDAEDGIQVMADAEVTLLSSAVANCSRHALDIQPGAHFTGTANSYAPPLILFNGKEYNSTQFKEYQAASGQDAESLTDSPMFRGCFRANFPKIRHGAILFTPGPTLSLTLPVEVMPDAKYAPANMPGISKGILKHDFEVFNPMSRVYPEPAKSKKGELITFSSTLSEEQAVSGKKSVKIQAALPGGERSSWRIKLFSEPMTSWEKPVTEISFQLYSEGDGTRFSPRIRDKQGESFTGPAMSMDWKGWRKIVWNLKNIKPKNTGAVKNDIQDCPLEIVVDFFPAVPAEGRDFTVYLDDLELK